MGNAETTRVMDAISRAVLRGATLDEIDRDLIEPLPLTEDQKSALWLWAWGTQRRSHMRREVTTLLHELSYASD